MNCILKVFEIVVLSKMKLCKEKFFKNERGYFLKCLNFKSTILSRQVV